MTAKPLVLADQHRLELFGAIGQGRLVFDIDHLQVDDHCVAWAVSRAGTIPCAVTWLGPGWHFDPIAIKERADEHAERCQAAKSAKAGRHRRELAQRIGGLRLGGHAERLLWRIHAATLAIGSSLLALPDTWLAEAVWGGARKRWPRHWRGGVKTVLRGLTYIHVADATELKFGAGTALLNHAGDLRGEKDEACPDNCLARAGGRHHHFLIDIGPAFLGVLEQFGKVDADTGIRTYRFPIMTGKKASGPSLRKVGKTGRVVSVFLPAKLGDPVACHALTPNQHRLLQALVRETTRVPADQRQKPGEVLVIDGNAIPNFWGNQDRSCPLLNKGGKFVGFNGNGKREGLGYKLSTPGGWLGKAGYPLDDVVDFLDDLIAVSKPLGLTIVGLDRKTRFYPVDELRRLSVSHIGRRLLDTLHLRVYTAADYLQRWTQHFGSVVSDAEPEPTSLMSTEQAIIALLADMDVRNISKRRLADGISTNQSFLCKVLAGKKPSPVGFLEKAQVWVAEQAIVGPDCQETNQAGCTVSKSSSSILPVALDCLRRGWCVLPQIPSAKRPPLKWKPFQERLPTEDEVRKWFRWWPDAGLAIVLGPVSKLFVIDVDGPEAHEELLRRLGSEPVAPKVLSGSGKPFKYHLYFMHPDLPTRAKQTPWHKQLEFRGHGGIIVVPPSLHPCGNRYKWAPGRSPDDLELRPVPPAVLEALKPARKLRLIGAVTKPVELPSGLAASRRTIAFLSGKCADGPKWNDQLFAAACDLHGRNIPKEVAEPLLLAGAQPWDYGEEENALRTIASAYAQPRTPSRY